MCSLYPLGEDRTNISHVYETVGLGCISFGWSGCCIKGCDVIMVKHILSSIFIKFHLISAGDILETGHLTHNFVSNSNMKNLKSIFLPS